MISMSAIPTKEKKSSSIKTYLIISGVLTAIGMSLFVYLMWYVSPVEIIERVEIIAVTDVGCIAETPDGYAVNIGQCDAKPGDYIMAPVDQKLKERAALMNPTGR